MLYHAWNEQKENCPGLDSNQSHWHCAPMFYMPRGAHLSDIEKRNILAFRNCGVNVCDIARKIKIWKRIIYSILKCLGNYVKHKLKGKRESLSVRQNRLTACLVCVKKLTYKKIRRDLNLSGNSWAARSV